MTKKSKCKKNCSNKNACAAKNKCGDKNNLPSLDAAPLTATTTEDMRPSAGAVAIVTSKNTPIQTVTEDATFTAERIHKSATTFYDVYSRYNAVRELAKQINGLPQSGALPPHVKINSIEFSFTIGDAAHVVSMAEVKTAGEIAPLLASTLSTLIEKMYQEIFSLNNISTAMQRAIETAIAKPSSPQNQANGQKG